MVMCKNTNISSDAQISNVGAFGGFGGLYILISHFTVSVLNLSCGKTCHVQVLTTTIYEKVAVFKLIAK